MPVADMVISLTSPVVWSGLSFLSTRMKELSVMGSEDFSTCCGPSFFTAPM